MTAEATESHVSLLEERKEEEYNWETKEGKEDKHKAPFAWGK